MGYCIGGCFALKLMERAFERVVAGVLVQTVRHGPEPSDYTCIIQDGTFGRLSYFPRRSDLQHGPGRAVSPRPLPRAARVRFLQRLTRLRALLPNADARPTNRNASPPVGILCRGRLTVPERRDHGVPMARAPPELKARTIEPLSQVSPDASTIEASVPEAHELTVGRRGARRGTAVKAVAVRNSVAAVRQIFTPNARGKCPSSEPSSRMEAGVHRRAACAMMVRGVRLGRTTASRVRRGNP